MVLTPILHCDRSLDFQPRTPWPTAMPALAWQNHLLTGFERKEGQVLDLWKFGQSNFLESLHAAHPTLALAEISRLFVLLEKALPKVIQEFREPMLAAYGLRWSDRLDQILHLLPRTPLVFQKWVDDKKVGARELAPLLLLADIECFSPFLVALTELPFTRAQGVQSMELVVELFSMGRQLNDLLPTDDAVDRYLKRLEQWRKPMSSAQDEEWGQYVLKWPWPPQVQAQWQRFGDQAGLEIKIRTTSPQDFHAKLERLLSIQDDWSCKS